MHKWLMYWFVVVAILTMATIVRFVDPDPVVKLRLLAFDTFQQVDSRTSVTEYPVRIVDIDEGSIAEVGQWPWPREKLALLVDRLSSLGTRIIAFDFVFPNKHVEATCNLPGEVLTLPEVASLLERLKRKPTGDIRLARSVKDRNVILGLIGNSGGAPNTTKPRASFALFGSDPANHMPAFKGATSNYGELQTAASGVGALNWFPEQDQVVRRVPMLVRVDQQIFPSLIAEVLRLAANESTIGITSSAESGESFASSKTGIISVQIGEKDIATDASGQVWVAFTKHDPERFRSAADVLSGQVQKTDFDGKIVLIGTSAAGLFDLRATPLEAALAGVEVHAQALEQLLLDQPLYRPDYSTGMEVFLTVFFSAALAIMSYLAGALVGALVGAVTVIMIFAFAWWSYTSAGMLVDPMYPTMVATSIYIFSSAYFYFQTERDRNQIRHAFAHYLAPSLLEQLTRQPDRVVLGGETRTLTVMFSDVRGFTQIAEEYRDNPGGLTQLMNRMLTPLSHAVMQRKGTIDKYIGDAIMAFWNAPLDDPAHARNACESALDMIDRLNDLNEERKITASNAGERFTPMRLGIGVATGLSMVGNMGSDIRFDYSVLGDTVNLASRLEGLTRQYGVPIILSDEACRQGGEGLAVIQIDRVRVAGREAVEPIWALLGDENFSADAEFETFSNDFTEALGDYSNRKWTTAASMFARIDAAIGDHDLSALTALFMTRCQQFDENPPPDDWDGAVKLEK